MRGVSDVQGDGMGVSHAQCDGRGMRGVSHAQGDGRGGGVRGVSHVQDKGR